MAFHVFQVKFVDFSYHLISHTAAAHVYVSSLPSLFILGAMSALDHVVLIWFHFKIKLK